MARRPVPVRYSTQEIINAAFDEVLGLIKTMPYGHDGQNAVALSSPYTSVKMTQVGAISYWGVAAPGAVVTDPVWQAFKLDETTGMRVTWADGNAQYDNLATDLTALSYS